MSPSTIEDSLFERRIFVEGSFTYADTEEEVREYVTQKLLYNCTTKHSLYETAKDLIGGYAIVLETGKNNRFCFTDPLGVKQLYFNEMGEVSSDITSLVKDTTRFSERYKSDAFKNGYHAGSLTPYEGIYRMIPNRLYHITNQGGTPNISMDCCNIISMDISTEGYENDTVSELIALGVSSCLRKVLHSKDKNLYVLLSGGLDSSIVAYAVDAACKCGDFRNIIPHYVTIKGSVDQTYAEIVAESLGVNLEFVTVADFPFSEQAQHILRNVNESPTDLGSVFPNYYLFSYLAGKNVITGDGADELFGGYTRALTYDSQKSDVFGELSYYHLPKLCKAADHFGVNLLCPFLTLQLVQHALHMPYEERVGKECLKEEFGDKLPKEIINRPKLPLKVDMIKIDPVDYKKHMFELFYDKNY